MAGSRGSNNRAGDPRVGWLGHVRPSGGRSEADHPATGRSASQPGGADNWGRVRWFRRQILLRDMSGRIMQQLSHPAIMYMHHYF